MRKKYLGALFAALLFTTIGLRAQRNSLSSGGEALGTGGNVSYSVGQVGYSASSGANGSVEAGVQQTYSILTSFGAEVTSIQLELSAYPNPVKDILTLKVQDYNQEEMTFLLFNTQGKLLEERKINTSLSSIKLRHLAASTYYLTVVSKDKAIKTFTIIKN
jgi:lipid-binding SYLF domain-containing protein